MTPLVDVPLCRDHVSVLNLGEIILSLIIPNVAGGDCVDDLPILPTQGS